jgi:hypothetical protein
VQFHEWEAARWVSQATVMLTANSSIEVFAGCESIVAQVETVVRMREAAT